MTKLQKEQNMVYVPTENDQKPTLNQLAKVLEIPAVRLQSAQVAYKPVEGQPYNAKEINWKAVSEFIGRRLDKTRYDKVEEVYSAALAVEIISKRKAGGTNKMLAGTTPMRKFDIAAGDTIVRKKDQAICKVLFANDTIVVYEPEHEEGEFIVSESIGNRMFNMNFEKIAE